MSGQVIFIVGLFRIVVQLSLLISRPLDGAAALSNILLKKKIFVSFCSFLSFGPVIINNSSFLLDAKTTTNRTTAWLMYSVKSSLSGGRRRRTRRGDNKMCSGVRQESTPTGRGLMSLCSVAGKEEKQTPEGRKVKKE